jgi:small-conductance mechanosensitive channel
VLQTALAQTANESTPSLGSVGGAIDRFISSLGYGLYATLVFLAAAVVGVLLAMLVKRMIKRTLLLSRLPPNVADLASKIAYYFIVILAALSGLALAGIDVTGFAFAGTLIGVALGFAAQTVASNFFSGLFLYIDKPLQPGEIVELPSLGIIGRVTEVTIFSTRIETIDGRIMRIPNEDIFNSTIVNLHRTVARRLEYRIGVSYDTDLERAINVVKSVLDSHPLVLAEPKPIVYVDNLGDSAIELVALFWVPSWKWLEVYRSLLMEIKLALDREGIEIPFPQRVVWVKTPLKLEPSETNVLMRAREPLVEEAAE